MDFWEEGCSRRLDLVGDFGARQNFGVVGRVWVELKVWSERTYEKEAQKWKEKLEAGLVAESRRDPTLQGVLLLAAKVPAFSGGRWGTPTLQAMLLGGGSGEWLNLAGAHKAARGQVKGAKPPLVSLLSKMEWHLDGKKRVGLLNDFLGAAGLPRNNAGQRAATYNDLLCQAGKTGRVVETKLKSKGGRTPWVASKSTFRDIYQFL